MRLGMKETQGKTVPTHPIPQSLSADHWEAASQSLLGNEKPPNSSMPSSLQRGPAGGEGMRCQGPASLRLERGSERRSGWDTGLKVKSRVQADSLCSARDSSPACFLSDLLSLWRSLDSHSLCVLLKTVLQALLSCCSRNFLWIAHLL